MQFSLRSYAGKRITSDTMGVLTMEARINGRRTTILAFAVALIASGWYVSKTSTYEIQPQTSISVHGTSTVHDFECKARLISGAIEIPTSHAGEVAQVLDDLQTVSVRVPVDKIDCGNGTMDKKMKAALASNK